MLPGLLLVVATLFAPAADVARPTPDARAIEHATQEVNRAIDAWFATADPSVERPPPPVELAALAQQRLFIRLGANPRQARAVLARLSGDIRRHAEATFAARQALRRLRPPPRPLRTFRAGRPLPPGVLLRHYRYAQRRFGVGWHVLAAVNFVESAFGRLRSPSEAGALGPMQFLPATWRAYGLGGNVRKSRDAIMGAANYLRASGAPRDYRRALYAYNRSTYYVDAVLRYALEMKRDLRSFYGYYSWQVFVRTPSGLRRLTGPGVR